MAISIFFSATIYQVSVSELERGLRRPLPAFEGQGVPKGIREQLIDQRIEFYQEARDKIVTRLVLTNLLIVVLGGMLSYYLALRTLKPIEDAHEAQRTFAASASHELRTPITTMRSENEVALMDPKLSLKDAKKQLRSNIEELEKLTALAEGLLQLAQAEGAHSIQEEIPIKEVVAAASERLATAATQRNITVNTMMTSKFKVFGNGAALTEIVVVLLDNAIKYSPENSTVKITASEDTSHITVKVKDEGPGIPADQLNHIFDRFYRADPSRTKQSVGGYGLGLAIASELAKTSDAQLLVESAVGAGSTFTLIIPKA